MAGEHNILRAQRYLRTRCPEEKEVVNDPLRQTFIKLIFVLFIYLKLKNFMYNHFLFIFMKKI